MGGLFEPLHLHTVVLHMNYDSSEMFGRTFTYFVTFGSTDRVDHDGVSAVTRCIVRVGWTETEVIQVEKL